MPDELVELTCRAAEALRGAFPDWTAPVAVLQTGTGFTAEGLLDEELGRLPYSALPGMPGGAPSPAGHRLEAMLGVSEGSQVLVLEGRRHLYEGYGPHPCVLPLCAAIGAGVSRVFLTSAVGGVREDWQPGTLVVLTDHINCLGTSPLIGNPGLGPSPFPEMQTTYSQELNAGFINAAAEVGLIPRLGVYQANVGPQFETPAEVEIAQRNGADVLGMSVVLEAIAARAMGAQVAALALITNKAAGYMVRPPSHEDVLEAGRFCSRAIMRALRVYLRSLSCDGIRPCPKADAQGPSAATSSATTTRPRGAAIRLASATSDVPCRNKERPR
ncbi:MAG: purine-nucleoside phosphorylase [Kiritimatiellaeota bacterium]|nr:purine-nucleoside phosphorylase [Kiritimatiellota bacterium]